MRRVLLQSEEFLLDEKWKHEEKGGGGLHYFSVNLHQISDIQSWSQVTHNLTFLPLLKNCLRIKLGVPLLEDSFGWANFVKTGDKIMHILLSGVFWDLRCTLSSVTPSGQYVYYLKLCHYHDNGFYKFDWYTLAGSQKTPESGRKVNAGGRSTLEVVNIWGWRPASLIDRTRASSWISDV